MMITSEKECALGWARNVEFINSNLRRFETKLLLGYDAHAFAFAAGPLPGFYSVLRPVSTSTYERIKKEYEEHERKI